VRPRLARSLLLLALLGPQESGPSKQGPSAEEVARAQAALDEAFRSRDAKRIQAALEGAHSLPHPGIVRSVARGLEDERAEVRLATLQALRWLEHPDALEVLHRAARNRPLMSSTELAGALLRALGQQADPRSIPVLARSPFEPDDQACLRARVFGLARIRTLESLEALIGILGVTGPGPGPRRVHGRMGDFRLALMLMTGVDQGDSPELWERWWRENRRSFRMPAEPQPLPKYMREVWERYWGLVRESERDRLREDRGREPAPRRED
jgi:hypothetical protein